MFGVVFPRNFWHFSTLLGAIHKWRQLNFRDFWPPPSPCQHFGPICSTKITQPPLLHQNLGNPLPPPLCWRHLWRAPYMNFNSRTFLLFQWRQHSKPLAARGLLIWLPFKSFKFGPPHKEAKIILRGELRFSHIINIWIPCQSYSHFINDYRFVHSTCIKPRSS